MDSKAESLLFSDGRAEGVYKTVAVTVDKETHRKLKILCAKSEVSVRGFLRAMISKAVEGISE